MAGKDGEPGVKIHRRSERETPEREKESDLPRVVTQLAQAKDKLARELEENLKQLKEVIKESQRIARELEMVMKEAQSPTALAIPAAELRRWGRGTPTGLPSPQRETDRRGARPRAGDDPQAPGDESEGPPGGVPDWFRGEEQEGARDQPH